MKPVAELDKARAARERAAPRATATSDVTRPRDMTVAAILGAIGACAAAYLLPSSAPESAPGPLARPHLQAKIACAACHEAENGPKKACANCHGAGQHASLRPAHKALAAKGELGCVTCHPAHGDARGVTFGQDGAYVMWAQGAEVKGALGHAAPAGATVPLVPLAICAKCHDPSDVRDPIASCIVQGAPVATCFDEHQKADEPPGRSLPATRCARQHGPGRYVAWEAAREIVENTPSPAPAKGAMPWAVVAIAFGAGTGALGGLSLFRRVRRNKPSRGPSAPLVPAQRVRLPQINAQTCLGCYACVDACPFDVLEIQRYVAVVARPADCCGVVLCQQACPNGSLTIQEGAPIEERPHVDEHLESKDTPGVFVAGDLSGLPLIKNAIGQGRRTVDRVAATLPSKERVKTPTDDRVDLVIVGAGPAGISASLRARELGLSYVTLEQGTVASSIQSFPRNKLVFDQPLHLPVEGELWLEESTKEELLAHWTRIVRARKLAIKEHHRVTAVAREDGLFAVTTERGTVRASRLLLAIGRRGTPRPLGCEIAPAALSRVSYALADARSFAGQRVVIVGLGDSAMEAALAIARQPAAKVTVTYRGAGFTRGRARNVAEMKRAAERGDVRVVFESTVARIDAQHVVLEVRGRHERVPYDHALVLIGGAPAWQLVQAAGVKLVAQVMETRNESDS